jgi:hypothetical protein
VKIEKKINVGCVICQLADGSPGKENECWVEENAVFEKLMIQAD